MQVCELELFCFLAYSTGKAERLRALPGGFYYLPVILPLRGQDEGIVHLN